MSDFEWLDRQRKKDAFFTQVLQYFKDGVVHLGYSVPVFSPTWAGEVRQSGLFFLGEIRRNAYENGNKRYRIAGPEKARLEMWWRAATKRKVRDALHNTKSKLRQAIYRAGEYYESSHRRSDPIDRLISIAIGFESLFSPGDKGELRFRISQSAAQFLGRDAAERLRIFEGVRDMYDRRSKVVHGTYDIEKYNERKFVTSEELDSWAAYLRLALVGFLALYLGGEKEREPILGRIEKINFDESERPKLQKDSNIEALLDAASRGISL